jgi:hypothetical protein
MGVVAGLCRNADHVDIDLPHTEGGDEHRFADALGMPFASGQPERSTGGATEGRASTALSETDKDAIHAWEWSGRSINTRIERSEAFERSKTVRQLDEALSKLPRYRGVAYKNMGFRDATSDVSAFTPRTVQERFPLDGEHRYVGYTSATTDPKAAIGKMTGFGKDVALAVKTSQAADLKPVAAMPNQAEVLIGRQVKLRTTHLEKNPVHGDKGEERQIVFAHTPNSSPVRGENLDNDWLNWARGGPTTR